MEQGFLQAVEQVIAALRTRRPASPSALLREWSAFVCSCEAGYRWTLYEYEDELGVRGVIQALLDDPIVYVYPEAGEWAREIAPWDARFRALLVPLPRAEGRPWWRAGILRYGGPEFVEAVRRTYGLSIEER